MRRFETLLLLLGLTAAACAKSASGPANQSAPGTAANTPPPVATDGPGATPADQGAPPAPAGSAAAPGGSGAAVAAAEVKFVDLDGLRAELQTRRKSGRPVFVNFWATWCGPCVEELPQLAALSREEAALGTDFVGISTDAWVTGEGAETETKVRAFMARAGIVYTNLIYRGDQDPLLNAFKLPGPIPFSILYDGQGRIVTSWTGPVPIAEVRRRLAGLRLPG